MSLNTRQNRFIKSFLHPLKQRMYFLRHLPMALISGTRLIELNENVSVAQVPFLPWNKNPFRSIYFAVMSMAAELSTAAPALLALKASDCDFAFIIVRMEGTFSKKATGTIRFTCTDYPAFLEVLQNMGEEAVTVTASTIGRDKDGAEVARFEFTWSFKKRK